MRLEFSGSQDAAPLVMVWSAVRAIQGMPCLICGFRGLNARLCNHAQNLRLVLKLDPHEFLRTDSLLGAKEVHIGGCSIQTSSSLHGALRQLASVEASAIKRANYIKRLY